MARRIKAKAKSPAQLKANVQAKNSSPASDLADFAEALAVGHRPVKLSVSDEALFRAFQSNLLSLISHELRTPLSAILNALGLLEDSASPHPNEFAEIPMPELIHMARQNAHRLQRALSALLDLASLESGTFHARMREVDTVKIVRGRVEAYRSLFKDRGVKVELEVAGKDARLLGDPQKLSRAIELCFQAMISRIASQTALKVRISSNTISLKFNLAPGSEPLWDNAWKHSEVGFQSGAFAGVMQSESEFLTRNEEGLGSELILIHEIMRIHRGKLQQARSGVAVELSLSLPELNSDEGLSYVLNSRAYQTSTELGSVALILIKKPETFGGTRGASLEGFSQKLKPILFRSSDALYPLPSHGCVALVLDDVNPEGVQRLIERLQAMPEGPLKVGFAHCPGDSDDPSQLVQIAARNLAK